MFDRGLERNQAQALIGRSVFSQYLIDRQIVKGSRLRDICGYCTLADTLRDRDATLALFSWLRETFNGDMFPTTATVAMPDDDHLARVADFLEAVDPKSGQRTLFPYQFDIIPVELISAIYEQFAHSECGQTSQSGRKTTARRQGVFYTRLPLVSLVLDEVLQGLSGFETVLDLTCGSGVFLVESLRRLVRLRAGSGDPSRDLIRSVLNNQVFGVDISEPAVRVAAFSLYLAALELDPSPEPPEALRFEPLIGRTLFADDARRIKSIPSKRPVLASNAGPGTIDVIVGNPPWSFGGKQKTKLRRQSNRSQSPLVPRGQGLDFVVRAMDFAHRNTRYGVIVSAAPFFSGSKTGRNAARHVVEKLAPVTIVNLANLSSWLFSGANVPAIVLFGNHRQRDSNQMTVVQVPWSPSGPRSHTFEVAHSDIVKLSVSEWHRRPVLLKSACCGKRRDLALVDNLMTRHVSLHSELKSVALDFGAGLTFGNRSSDASFLHGFPLLESKEIRPFSTPSQLPKFSEHRAESPRRLSLYQAPLLVIREFFKGGPRLIAGIKTENAVFTDSCFGVSFKTEDREILSITAAILNSAITSWFLLMTSSTFGISIRRAKLGDIKRLPVPDLRKSVETTPGRILVNFERSLQGRIPDDKDWNTLDETVFELYGLNRFDRVVVRDGLFRASWQWKSGRDSSVDRIRVEPEVFDYARRFVELIDIWLSARNLRRMRAEVFELRRRDPLRVVRFVLEDKPGPSIVEVVRPDGELRQLLLEIGRRLSIPLSQSIVGSRELRVANKREVIVIKPAACRHWLGISALEDADAIISASLSGVSV